jgi:hypothetical protein
MVAQALTHIIKIINSILVRVVKAVTAAAVPEQASAHVAAMAVPVATAVANLAAIGKRIVEKMVLLVLLVIPLLIWVNSMWTRI